VPPELAGLLNDAGVGPVVAVREASGGLAAQAAVVELASGETVFAKTLADPPGDDVFDVEAEGLAHLRAAGARTPEVVACTREVLVLRLLEPRRDEPSAWEELAHQVATVHATISPRYGWHRDGWLGAWPQHNTWEDDGHTFFAQHRVLRWLPERRVRAKLDLADRRALERLCDRLPELLPNRRACLTHGDLWSQNVMATADGVPALIDPAVSFMWPEVDLSHLWCSPRPPASDRFFDVYAEVTELDAGWRERMPLVHLRQLMALVAMFDHDWGSTETVKGLVAPFRAS
jgi:fructosamine-3-kinase